MKNKYKYDGETNISIEKRSKTELPNTRKQMQHWWAHKAAHRLQRKRGDIEHENGGGNLAQHITKTCVHISCPLQAPPYARSSSSPPSCMSSSFAKN